VRCVRAIRAITNPSYNGNRAIGSKYRKNGENPETLRRTAAMHFVPDVERHCVS
jgi:hypothetical protein